MKVYLIDYLGCHAGMHYYLDTFKDILDSGNLDVEILSNYSKTEEKPFFLFQYKGSLLNKGRCWLINYMRFRRFVKKHKGDCHIFLTYGGLLDLFFFHVLSSLKYHVIDIHEIIIQHQETDKLLLRLLKWAYNKKLKNVIIHSKRSKSFLDKFGFGGKIFMFPLEYHVPLDYNLNSIQDDVLTAFDPSKKNYLFFGSMTYEKGVDYLIESFNHLDETFLSQVNLVVAGKDYDGSVHSVKPKENAPIKILARHIGDDEMAYLYSKTDFVCLPHRKTSQSGVLEMAIHFKKPVIASNIPYFKLLLSNYDSFGIITEEGKDYTDTIIRSLGIEKLYYSEQDCKRYSNRIEFEQFIIDFKEWISK